MLKIINVKGAYAPRVFCDACGEPITDAANAVVIYHGNVEEGQETKFSYAHKGKCDKKQTAELGDDGGTAELDVHMAYMLNNLGMKPDKVKRAFETAARLDSIG